MTYSNVRRLLAVAPNWMGDALMAMPALTHLRRLWPHMEITVLTRPQWSDLWRMCPAVNRVETLDKSVRASCRFAMRHRPAPWDAACIFPNSARSALTPFLMNIPVRRGWRGRWRHALLTELAPEHRCGTHQALEYAALLGIRLPLDWRAIAVLAPPLPAEAKAFLDNAGLGASQYAVVLPGAARGPAKRWPPDRFAAVAAHWLRGSAGRRVAVCGCASEDALCSHVASCVGPEAVSLAGKTDIRQLAAVLTGAVCVICNDSGGMHLASCCGARTVAIFGMTSAESTGPMGLRTRVVVAEGVRGRRDIPRDADDARAAIESISVERVASAIDELLNERA